MVLVGSWDCGGQEGKLNGVVCSRPKLLEKLIEQFQNKIIDNTTD